MQDGRLCRPIQVQDIDRTRPDRPVILLGEILISPHQALRQAAELGQPIERELAFLAVHGLLHLLGYDHDLPRREQKMLRLQRRILLDTGKTEPLPAGRTGAARPNQGTPQEIRHD
jgi:probable rRNA maturation factor